MLYTPSPLIRRIQKILKYQCPYQANKRAKMDIWIDSEDLTTFYYGKIEITINYYDNSFRVYKPDKRKKIQREYMGYTVKELDEGLKACGYKYLFQPSNDEETFLEHHRYWFPELEEKS